MASHPAVASSVDPAVVPVVSPCVRLCTLDDDDVCVGCGRTLDDIRAWSKMSDPDKIACKERAVFRLQAMGRPVLPASAGVVLPPRRR